jgi:hypothetical protein
MNKLETTPPEEMTADQLRREIAYLQSLSKRKIMSDDTTGATPARSGRVLIIEVRA